LFSNNKITMICSNCFCYAIHVCHSKTGTARDNSLCVCECVCVCVCVVYRVCTRAPAIRMIDATLLTVGSAFIFDYCLFLLFSLKVFNVLLKHVLNSLFIYTYTFISLLMAYLGIASMARLTTNGRL
jgi:hypothetical protein